MNYLAHHDVARRAEPDARPAFFVANTLPDLLANGGVARLRARHAAHNGENRDVSRGIRLHLATDRRFHSHPDFRAASGEVSALLLSGFIAAPSPEKPPPRRLFFLAHVAVEFALDAFLLRRDPSLADDFYARFAACDLAPAASAIAQMTNQSTGVPAILAAIGRFTGARYLYDYTTDDGLACAMNRVCIRAGLPGFPSPEDRAGLARVFAGFVPRIAFYEAALLSLPERSSWYNEGAKNVF